MNTSDVYDRFILKAEKNSVNDGISTDKRRFVELYNEYQIRYLEYIYDKKNEDDFRYIESLLVKNKKLIDSKVDTEMTSFELPKNYFDFSSAYALGSKGSCLNKKIDLFYEIKDIERNFYVADEFTKPSFEYREAPYMIGGGDVNVFHGDMSINSLILSFYRYPHSLRLQNPDNPESEFDDNIELDFDEKSINKIVTAAVSGFDINNNSERWQINNVFAKKDL